MAETTTTPNRAECDALGLTRDQLTNAEEEACAVIDELTAEARWHRAQADAYDRAIARLRQVQTTFNEHRRHGETRAVLVAAAHYLEAMTRDAYEEFHNTDDPRSYGPALCDPDPEPTREEQRAGVLRTANHIIEAAVKADGAGRGTDAAALRAIATALTETTRADVHQDTIAARRRAAFEAAVLIVEYGRLKGAE